MQDNTIYTRQMAILIFLSSTAVKLSSLPALWARDISTSVFLAMIFMTLVEIVLFCLVYVFVERGGVELLDKSKIRYRLSVNFAFQSKDKFNKRNEKSFRELSKCLKSKNPKMV